ncbi:hypothetical protein GCM10009430_32650 [Aquimarina litoralis]|uniref:Pentapeptide repeat-containing protein n=1 Tax=Aquimarina litoralis TaxID=584605 RepID=A0ABN1J1Y8_9FLAO
MKNLKNIEGVNHLTRDNLKQINAGFGNSQQINNLTNQANQSNLNLQNMFRSQNCLSAINALGSFTTILHNTHNHSPMSQLLKNKINIIRSWISNNCY